MPDDQRSSSFLYYLSQRIKIIQQTNILNELPLSKNHQY